MSNDTYQKEFEIFCREYCEKVSKLINGIKSDDILELIKHIKSCYARNSNIFLIGNGGSASTCSHWANDMGVGLSDFLNVKFIKILSLTDNTSVISAIANDKSYDEIFVKQLELYFREGDMVIIISASGNSKNLILASDWVKKKNGTVVSLVGFNGGKLKQKSDFCLHIRSELLDYGPTEDIHLIICHMISRWIRENGL